ncbi:MULTISPECIES: hypothetical protein [unclassified Streptomyces]|uniref:hypothetical protein n=1 Tax=unclassified Streptomyces TaxID=2593676 RepID=UPI0019078898|nr:hypothetical protein [Streptomyces sp. HSG2]
MSLEALIARADERSVAASGLACLDRCLPLLGGEDETLRPLWGSLAPGGDPALWGPLLTEARNRLQGVGEAHDRAAGLAREMLATAPLDWTAPATRRWADDCSLASLGVHRTLDPAEDPTPVRERRSGRTGNMPPLVAAELRRQVTVLEVLAGHGAPGLRRALEVTTEGRRVLRAVVSRRSRGVG